jgi:hypothetical protein
MTMKHHPRNRSRKRGAALVEAAIAIPVMLVFLGTTMFAHRSYDEKMALQMSARSEVLYNASHSCEEQAPGEMAKQLGAGAGSGGTSKEEGSADPTGGEAGTVDTAAGKLRDSERQGISRSWNLLRTSRSSSANGSAIVENKTFTLNRPISANSEVACNEKRFDNDWTAIFGFIAGYAQSGAGFID